ncbi:MAG: GspH/FimT family pseudopilin [Methylococcales bacterium]|nr:GspH/FimT family pseudopilin [Methylococcales bacterium]
MTLNKNKQLHDNQNALYKPLQRSQGFTLIELLVTLAIAGVLIHVAIPSFTATIASNQAIVNANKLVSAYNLARSEAIKRGQQVTVRRVGLLGRHWEAGWNVFVDVDGNNVFNDDGDATLCEAGEDCLLRTYPALPTGYTLTSSATLTTYKDYAAFLPSGASKSMVADTITLCAPTHTAVIISINAMGRPRVVAGTC